MSTESIKSKTDMGFGSETQKQQVTVTTMEQQAGNDDTNTSRLTQIFRSARFQILVVSALAFCGPAMSDAIQNLGGGGSATAQSNNAATSASYVAVFIVSILGGPLASRIGIRNLLILGAMTFPINASSYYVNLKYKIQWYLVLGRTIYGFGFGAWYVAEAAIILSYPEEGRRGSYLAIWVMSRNLGQLVGGSINLSRNIHNAKAGAVATSTFLIFLVIEALAFPISWLISPSNKVKKADGTQVKLAPKQSWKEEFGLLWGTLTHKRTLCLAVYFFYSYFYGGVLGTYLALHFSVRARALSTLIVPLGIILFVFLLGLVLDSQKMTQRRRAQVGFLIVMTPTIAAFIWLTAYQASYDRKTAVKLDWTSPGWANAYLPYYILQITGYMCQTYIYWLISCFSDDVTANARNGGVFRAIEAAGQAVSYGLNSKVQRVIISIGINFALCLLAIPGCIAVIQTVPMYRQDAKQVRDAAQQQQMQESSTDSKA